MPGPEVHGASSKPSKAKTDKSFDSPLVHVDIDGVWGRNEQVMQFLDLMSCKAARSTAASSNEYKEKITSRDEHGNFPKLGVSSLGPF